MTHLSLHKCAITFKGFNFDIFYLSFSINFNIKNSWNNFNALLLDTLTPYAFQSMIYFGLYQELNQQSHSDKNTSYTFNKASYHSPLDRWPLACPGGTAPLGLLGRWWLCHPAAGTQRCSPRDCRCHPASACRRSPRTLKCNRHSWLKGRKRERGRETVNEETNTERGGGINWIHFFPWEMSYRRILGTSWWKCDEDIHPKTLQQFFGENTSKLQGMLVTPCRLK